MDKRGKDGRPGKRSGPSRRPAGAIRQGVRGGPLQPIAKPQPSEDDGRAALPPGYQLRDAAVHILEAVLVKKLPLDRAIEMQEPWLARLDGRDRGFALTIVRAVLRRLRFLEAVLARLIDRPLPKEASRIRLTLLVGAAQLALLDTPPHAAVNLAVEQCRRDRIGRGFANLANAVLRRVPDTAKAVAKTWDAPASDFPDWLFERWSATYGEPTARRMAAASLEKPALDISVKADPAKWAAALEAIVLPTGSLRLADAGAVPELAGFSDDAWWVQDAAAALPARLLGDVAGKRVADLCAAPGGKTAQLASAGARVTAVDTSGQRLVRLEENLRRLKLEDRVEVVAADIDAYTAPAPFDAVLLDAPCSATGTIRRHPDILHLKSTDDVTRLAAYQGKLLARAATLVKPGGRLVYCTCSLEPEEGPEQIAAFLSTNADFQRLPIAADEIGGAADWITPDGDLRTFPFHMQRPEPGVSGLDGFFAARLVRR